jgi:predicted nucleic acid-binding protein
MKQRIYIDTSVIGGYYDIEFATATKQLFNRIANKEFDVYLSEVNEAELMNASLQVKEVKNMNNVVKKEKRFDTVAFFRTVKEKMAKATEGRTLEEERKYWKLMREGKIQIT